MHFHTHTPSTCLLLCRSTQGPAAGAVRGTPALAPHAGAWEVRAPHTAARAAGNALNSAPRPQRAVTCRSPCMESIFQATERGLLSERDLAMRNGKSTITSSNARASK